MKQHKRLILAVFLILSLACGRLQVQIRPDQIAGPTQGPGAINTFIAQTAELAFTQTASAAPPTPTATLPATPTLALTVTPLPEISVIVEMSEFTPNNLYLFGHLRGISAGNQYQSFAKLNLYDAQKQKLAEQEMPCVEVPAQDRYCQFVFTMGDPPTGIASYEITAEIHVSEGLILTGHTEGVTIIGQTQASLDEEPTALASPQAVQPQAANPISAQDVIVSASFHSEFYRPEEGSFFNVHVSYFGDAAPVNSFSLDACVSITEHRRYESGRVAQVLLTEECKAVYLSGESKSARGDEDFSFKPSGYGFVWNNSPEGRYQISEIRGLVNLKQNQKVLESASSSHRPVPVRLVESSLPRSSSSQATATVEVLAGSGEMYDLKLSVVQMEVDPDEVAVSSFLLFLPCLLPLVCDDRVEVASVSQPIKLVAGTDATISASYFAVPASESGNVPTEFKMTVYFEDIVIGTK
ncbi:MAG: hypothetical protein IT310_14135 [Anaerolineales bacterium]|nr:hypothetical protein [Anaerolineales bacterium]